MSILSSAIPVLYQASKDRCEELGFPWVVLEGAILAGEAARDGCRPNHPRIFPGTAAWADRLDYLKTHMPRVGGYGEENNNLNYILNRDKTTTLLVMSGTKGTGRAIAGTWPKNRHPKGNLTIQTIEVRNGQMGLFEEDDFSVRHSVYVLLIHRDKTVVYSELSRPATISQGFIVGWHERNILPPIEIGSVRLDALPSLEPDVDVPIKKRDA